MLHIVHRIQGTFPRHADAIIIVAVVTAILALGAGISLALSR